MSKKERVHSPIDAVELYLAFRRRFWFIALVTILTLAIATARAMHSRSFRAEAQIEVASVAFVNDARYVPAIGDLRYAIPRTYTPNTYERLLLSSSVIAQTIDCLVEDGVYDPERAPTVDALRGSLRVYVDVLDQTTRPVTYSPIIRLEARDEAAETCVAKLEAWADVAIAVTNDMLATQFTARSEMLAEQRDRLEAELTALRQELSTELTAWNSDAAQRELELSLERIDQFAKARQKLVTRIQGSDEHGELGIVDRQIALERTQLEEQRAEWAKHKMDQDRLQAEVEVAQSVLNDIAKESAFSDVALSFTADSGQSGDRAVGLNLVSDRIVSSEVKGSMFSAILAGFSAFVFVTFAVFVLDVWLPSLARQIDSGATT